MKLTVEEISVDIVGQIFNDILVTQVTDGTLNTVPHPVYRYKFPIKGGYLKDKEEKIIIKESRSQMFGTKIDGRQLGTELIDVRCGDPDDKRVWWVKDPVFGKKVIYRDPGTRRPVTIDVLRRPVKHSVGTYQEFVDLVNSRDGGKPHPDDEIGDFGESHGDELPEDTFTDDDTDYIKANYMTMTDKEMAKELGADVGILRDFRLKTLKLKKPRGGVRG